MDKLNSKQPLELGGILREAMETYPYKLGKEQYKAVEGIIRCRTKELGGHEKVCGQCNYKYQAYNSCRNRHCPKCQFVKQGQWVDKLAGNIPCFSGLKTKLYSKDWNVYLKKALGEVNSVLKYLGRYTHHVAISNNRLISATNKKVSFRYKDNRSNGKIKIMELGPNEFIRRSLQHILPDNFYKIRYVGILAMVNVQTKKAQCIALINSKTEMPVLEGLNAVSVVELIVKPDILLCPKCKKGRLVYKIRGDN